MTASLEIPNAVFVYGTLKRGQVRASLWPCPPLSVCTATIQAALHDLGAYPAVTQGDDIVQGEMWSFSESDIAKTLVALDRIEWYQQDDDDLYVRTVVECETEYGETRDASTYFYARPAELSIANRVVPGEDGCCRWPAKK